MSTKYVSDVCIDVSRNEYGIMDIESANILCNLVMISGSGILNKFEEQGIRGKEIRLLFNRCEGNLHKLAETINNGDAREKLCHVKESNYYLNVKQEKPGGFLKFLRIK